MTSDNSPCRNIIVISDTHCGCQLGLCMASGAKLAGSGVYEPSDLQQTVWRYWVCFWDEWIPFIIGDEPYILVVNGDVVDGVHHGATHHISANLDDQRQLAYEILKPRVDKASEYYHVTGTEAHVGQSGCDEEAVARMLGSKPDAGGKFSRAELWLRVGGLLIDFKHHIGAVSSAQSELNALTQEATETLVECAKWGLSPPDIIVRSHRHRCAEIGVPTQNGIMKVFTTASWQLKTPFTQKIKQARIAVPQFGGSLIQIKEGEANVRHYIRTIGRSKEERA